jgi:hypothetical protein
MKAYIDELTAIAALLTGTPAFYHEHQQMMNIRADALTGAVVFAPALGFGKYEKVGGGFMPNMKIAVMFLKQTQFENDILQNQSIIQDMEDMAVEFMQRVNASTVFIHPTQYETQYVYETFDANFAGIGLTFNCQLRTPLTSCV